MRLSREVMMTPNPATLKIINGRQGKAETLVVKSQAFHLIAEEAQAAPDVVTGMYLYHVLFLTFIIYANYYLTVCRDVFSQWFD